MGAGKRILTLCLALALLAQAALAAPFSTDTEAINRAALSVMKLEIYDSGRELKSTGSGFVAFTDSLLVTNYHVVRGAYYVAAYSDDGDRYMATHVLAADEDKDIAILAFSSPTGIEPLELDLSDDVIRAAPVIAIGSPKGYKNSVSNGIVSSVFEENGISYIQFTAPVSSGSSGGALFNDAGQVIGITTWVYNDGYGINQNLNFAVSIREVYGLYRAHERDTLVAVADWTGGAGSRTPAATASPLPSATPGPGGRQAPKPEWRDMVTAVIGDPFSFTQTEFREAMEVFGLPEESGFTWADEPLTTFGYNMYALSNEEGTVVLTVHEMDGPGSVSAFEIDGFVSKDDPYGDGESIGSDIGALLACMYTCAYVLEKDDVSYDDLIAAYDAMGDLFDALDDPDVTEERLNSGVSVVFDVLGYPGALSIKKVTSDGDEYYWLCLEMLPVDGTFE